MLHTLGDLDRAMLASLGREWMLHGHLQDRVGMALVLEVADRPTMETVAIEEWMAVSPVYSRRMQRAMGFVGDDVVTIMKNLQLDIGAPHQFMDFRYTLQDARHGEFRLAHCGALMDVEPMGEQYVHGMCHTIEDPTFDATAGATNPLAQVRPIHRPPRVPANRTPHCAWTIAIVPDADPVAPTPLEHVVAASALAGLPIPDHDRSGDGWPDYSGAFDPDFGLEDLSHGALLVTLEEFALQSHLLLRGFLLSVSSRFGEDVAAGMLPRVVGGWCGLTAQRLVGLLALEQSPEGVASMLLMHPMLAPRAYTGAKVELRGDEVVLSFAEAPAAHDDDGATWWGSPAMAEALTSVVQAAFPRARLRSVDDRTFSIVVEATAEPVRPIPEVSIAQISTGASFRFQRRRPLRV